MWSKVLKKCRCCDSTSTKSKSSYDVYGFFPKPPTQTPSKSPTFDFIKPPTNAQRLLSSIILYKIEC